MGNGVSGQAAQQVKQYAQVYGKEAYRAAQDGFKATQRATVHGIELARAINRKIDISGKKRKKAAENSREERRKKILEKKGKKKGGQGEEEGEGEEEEEEGDAEVHATATHKLKVVAGDNDIDEEKDEEEPEATGEHVSRARSIIPKIPGEGIDAEQEEDPTLMFGLNVADNRKPTSKHAKDPSHLRVKALAKKMRVVGRRLRLECVDKMGDKTLIPSAGKGTSMAQSLQETEGAVGIGNPARALLAAAKFKQKIEKRHLEQVEDTFEIKAVRDPTLDKYGGTDVLGWNRCHLNPVTWTELTVYIIRAPGECYHEVTLMYTKILDEVQAALVPYAIVVHMRDLASRHLGATEHDDGRDCKLPAISAGLRAIAEPNCLRVVLLGDDYGPSWRMTSSEDHENEEVPYTFDKENVSLSELEILATFACESAELTHKAFKKKATVPRTLLYSCVDPEAAGMFADQEDSSSIAASSLSASMKGMSPKGKQRSFLKGSQRGAMKDSRKGGLSLMTQSLAGVSQGGMSHGTHAHSVQQSSNPLAILKAQKKAARKKRKEQLKKLNKLVFPALVRDPITGRPRDPKHVFELLDEDGGGTVDKEEFRNGLIACKLELSDEDLDLVWENLDEDGGGTLDMDELCTKLEQQYNKIKQSEAKHLKYMPRILSSKLDGKLVPNTVKARADTMKDFLDTAERQRDRWYARFIADMTADLKRLLPILAAASQDLEDDKRKAVDEDKDAMPLSFIPELPEYLGHSEAVYEHARAGKVQSPHVTRTLSSGVGRTLSGAAAAPGATEMEEDEEGEYLGGKWPNEAFARIQIDLLESCKGLINWPCILVGERGSGRSHILRNFVFDMRRERPMDHIVVHTVGSNPEVCDLSLVLFHLCCEVGKRFDVWEEILDMDPSTIAEAFPRLLLKLEILNGVLLVLVIDGIEHITVKGEEIGGDVSWFPTAIPASVRLVLSCSEGQMLNALRRKRARFDGSAEVFEFKMPRWGGSMTISGDDVLSSSSSSGSGAGEGDEPEDGAGKEEEVREMDPAVVKVLLMSKAFRQLGLEATPHTDVFALVEALVKAAKEFHGPSAVDRYVLLVMLARDGILESDLYSLLNANSLHTTQIPFCRVSHQQFVALRDDLDPVVSRVTYNHQPMRTLAQAAFLPCLQDLVNWQEMYVEMNKLIGCHYLQELAFLTDPNKQWHGEHARPLTEVVYHLAQANEFDQVFKVVSSTRYMEARCCLGKAQAVALYWDYKLLLNRSSCKHFWIKTDFMKVEDCCTMLRVFSSTFVRHPRWIFSIAASLPDTTGPAQIAKSFWSAKHETRPQLAWLNKPQMSNPCVLNLNTHGFVVHCACFSHDMTRIIAGGQDKHVHVWTYPQGRLIAKLQGHIDHVMSVQVSVDDKYIVTGSRDGNVILWFMPHEHELDSRIKHAEEATRLYREEYGDDDDDDDDRARRTKSSKSRASQKQAGEDGEEEEASKKKTSRPGTQETAISRASSRHSVRFTNREGAKQRAAAARMEDLLVDPNKMVCLIQAHTSTVWSVAYSTQFQYTAKLEVKVKEKINKRGDFKIHQINVHGNFARLGTLLDETIVFPVGLAGLVVITREHTPDELRLMRLKLASQLAGPADASPGAQGRRQSTVDASVSPAKSRRASVMDAKSRRASVAAPDAKSKHQSPVTGTKSRRASVVDPQARKQSVVVDPIAARRQSMISKGSSRRVSQANPEGKSRRQSMVSQNLDAWLADLGDDQAKERETAAQHHEAMMRAGVPEFEKQYEMSGKIVLFPTGDDKGEERSDLDLIRCVRKFKAFGAIAVILMRVADGASTALVDDACDDLQLPVVTVDNSAGKQVQPDCEVMIKKVLVPGALLASAASDRTVKLWDANKALKGLVNGKRPVAVLDAHKSYVTHVSFNPWGDKLATSGGDNVVNIWDTTTFQVTSTYDHALAPVTQTVWSSDGSMGLSSSHDGFFRLWSPKTTETMKVTTGPHHGHMWSVAISDDQKLVATGGHDGKVVIWDVGIMMERNKELMVLEGHGGPVFSLSFSADGTRCLSSSSDRSLCVWATDHDLATYSLHHLQATLEQTRLENIKKMELADLVQKSRRGWSNAGGAKTIWEQKEAHTQQITSICFSSDGRDIATASADLYIYIWSVANMVLRKTLSGHTAGISAMSYSRDSAYLASGDTAGDVRVWDAFTGRKLYEMNGHKDRIWGLDFSANSMRMVTSSGDQTIRLWRLDDPYANAGNKTGLRIYEDDEVMQAASSRPPSQSTDSPKRLPTLKLESLNISVDNRPPSGAGAAGVAGGGAGGGIIPTENGGLLMNQGAGKQKKDGERSNNGFKAYDEQRNALLQVVQCPRVVHSVKFSPNGSEMAAASQDSLVHLYRFKDQNQEEMEEYEVVPKEGDASKEKHRSYVKMVLWDRQARRIVTCGVDGTVKLWSSRNGLLLRTFVGHEKEVWHIAISPDDRTILSSSLDNTARMWNTDTGDELFQVTHKDTIHAGAFSPDGRRFATCSHDGCFKVWEKDESKFQKTASRGWPRVRELLPKIARLRNVPCALSKDGRICCYALKKNKGTTQESAQTITITHTVRGTDLYRFKLMVPVDLATITPDGNTVVFAYGMVLRIFQNGLLTCEVRKAHRAAILELRFSESAHLLATGGDDCMLKVWRIDDDGALVLVKKLKGHTSSVKAACFSPNDALLASGSADLCVKLWSTQTWKILCTIKAHDNFVTVVAFDAPGSKMLTAGDDQTIRVWALPKRPTHKNPPIEILRIQNLQSTVVCADFSEDGTRVVGVLAGRQIYVWHATDGTALTWWQFCPIDQETYTEALWRTGHLALSDDLNAIIVTDSAGNTLTFALLKICAAPLKTLE